MIRSLYISWSQESDLNRRPADYESAALPTELSWPVRVNALLSRVLGPVKLFLRRFAGLFAPLFLRINPKGFKPA